MAEKHDILHRHFIEGKGIKTIARELTMSKNTVRNYIREFSRQKLEIINGGDRSELLLAMNEKPRYKATNRERSVVTEEVLNIIKACISENEKKRTLGQAKNCMKATDIHEYLLEKNINISYPTVNNYVRQFIQEGKEAFIKQSYEFGEICEFDWGEVKLTIAGKLTTYRLAVFALAATNIRYAFLYRNEDTQAFIDSHIKFFAYICGIPKTMVYDNMRVAIAKFVGKHEKVATIALKQLSVYYGFSFRFCNICKGNEKGHVERSVEVVRRKAFSSMSDFANTYEANVRLEAVLERLNTNKQELLEKEQAVLLPKIPDYSSVVRQTGAVDKFSTVVYKQNHYSVPDYLVGKEVDILAFIDMIIVKFHGNELANHERSYGNHTYVLDISHYRETLLKKPGAIKNSLCLKQSHAFLKIIFDRFFSDNPKEFILMLDLLSEYKLDKLKKSIEILNETGAKVQLDNIKMILGNKSMPQKQPFCDEIEKACERQLLQYNIRGAVTI